MTEDIGMSKAFLTPEELAGVLGLGRSTVYRALESGELPGRKVCGRWRTLRSQLDERVRDERVPRPDAGDDPMPRAGRRPRVTGTVRSKVFELSERGAG
jgi:excisionase family DNA binding protein